MMLKTRIKRENMNNKLFTALFLLISYLLLFISGTAQSFQNTDSDSTRKDMQVMWDEFDSKRTKATTSTSGKKRNGPTYVPTRSVKEEVTSTGDPTIGITIWRLRSSTIKDRQNGTKALRLKKSDRQVIELIPERASVGTPLEEGERVRISIEVPRKGYLYVIDREEYEKGFGEPYLIFPTLRMRGGNNVVAPGRLIEIPARNDDPPFFTLERSGNDHIGEEISVLVASTPIPELRTGASELKLTKEQFAKLERYAEKAESFELKDGVGTVWTEEEVMAGTNSSGGDGKKSLRQGDPAPQTIYRIAARPDAPVMIKVPLKIKRHE
jgi:hypothetical protein